LRASYNDNYIILPLQGFKQPRPAGGAK